MNSDQARLIEVTIEDGIVIAKYSSPLTLDLDVAKEMIAKRLVVQQGQDYPCLLDVSIGDVSKEALRYFKKEGAKGLKAGAFTVDSPFSKFVMNLILTVLKPKFPTKVFNDTEEALTWLRQFKNESE